MLCAVKHCSDVAVVIVADPSGDQAALCRQHWVEAARRSHDLIKAVRLAPKSA